MPPTIICVRHGQGLHNVGIGNYTLPDPNLTPLGEQQCLALKDSHFPEQSHISLVTASPLSRAIASASLIFQPSLRSPNTSNTILALPDAQETSDDPCDIGLSPGALQEISQQYKWPVDLSLIKDGWNEKCVGGRYSPATGAIECRARDVRARFRERARELVAAGDQDVNIVLVAHGGFLHYFTDDWEDSSIFPGTGWRNCETRAYTFERGVEDDTDTDARLIESMDSRRRRGLLYPMLAKEKQHVLFNQAMQEWEDQGLQNPCKIGIHESEIVIV